MKKKILITAFALLFLVISLPTLFNLLLFARYDFNNELMTRHSGEYGQLHGEWKLAYDSIPCGFDTLTEWHLVIGGEGDGKLYVATYWDKSWYPGGSQIGTFASLLPYDKNTVSRDTCAVKRVDHNLVLNDCFYAPKFAIEDTSAVLQSLGSEYTIDDIPYLNSMLLHYEVQGNRLYIGEVKRIGEPPEKLGLSGSPSFRLRDTLGWWQIRL